MTGKMNGRGAYVCRSKQCLEIAVRKKGLERSLRCRVDAQVYEDLLGAFADQDS